MQCDIRLLLLVGECFFKSNSCSPSFLRYIVLGYSKKVDDLAYSLTF